MLFETLWARASQSDLHAAPPIHARSSLSKKFRSSSSAPPLRAMPMRKGLFVMGMSMLVYSGAVSHSLDFYRALAFLRCLRHAKRVDAEQYARTDFADFQRTLAYFAKTSGDVAEHFLAISKLEGDAQRKAHGILHRACKDVHRIVKDFDEDIGQPGRWEQDANQLVFFLVEVIGDKLLAELIHAPLSTALHQEHIAIAGISTPGSYATSGTETDGKHDMTTRLRQVFSIFSPSHIRKESSLGKEDTTPKALPTFDELPSFKEYKGCAWSVWGEDDQLGTVNLLTEEIVKKAAAEEIRTGQTVSLNWPVNFPNKPMFGRKSPEVKMIKRPHGATRDDELHINTQSGSQWDGMRHFGVAGHDVFYNNTHKDAIPGGLIPIPDPKNIDPSLSRIGIQNWASHGICGRGVLLDLVRFYTADGKPLPYDPWTSHPISVKELQACFMSKFYEESQEGRDALGEKPETFAGIEQSDDMKRFLWDNHFSAVASDQPALEVSRVVKLVFKGFDLDPVMQRWPTPEGVPHMHQTILGMWGMPIGEMFDVEKLADICAETHRYTFFFSSWPLPIIGGCASPPNAAAYF
ncbi:hypothetical protein BDZ89DRAFT_1162359 [Hymenopellis radicata]|nr:hypothetical protein BDZ89DRAFT_1162359 [Hymenopellis radicata]